MQSELDEVAESSIGIVLPIYNIFRICSIRFCLVVAGRHQLHQHRRARSRFAVPLAGHGLQQLGQGCGLLVDFRFGGRATGRSRSILVKF